jgi:hypothetical protein
MPILFRLSRNRARDDNLHWGCRRVNDRDKRRVAGLRWEPPQVNEGNEPRKVGVRWGCQQQNETTAMFGPKNRHGHCRANLSIKTIENVAHWERRRVNVANEVPYVEFHWGCLRMKPTNDTSGIVFLWEPRRVNEGNEAR